MKVDFAGELPAIEKVLKRLEQLVAAEITSEALVDDEGFFGVELDCEAVGGGLALLPDTDSLGYLSYTGISTYNLYLMNALAVVLLELGGRYEHASSLPAAAKQPWQLARQWYQRI